MSLRIKEDFNKNLFNKGLDEFYKKNYSAALTYFFNLGFKDNTTYHNISLCYLNIGNSFYNLRNFNEAKKYYNYCLSYANDTNVKNNSNNMIKNCNANIIFDKARNFFDKKNFTDAFNLYNEAEQIFTNDEDIKICQENKGHCIYNYSNRLMDESKTESDYNKVIDSYKKAKGFYNDKINKDLCVTQIKKCRSYIYKIKAEESKDINDKIFLIEKAISTWPDFNKDYFINEKSRYLYNKGIHYFNKKNYEEALNYFNKSYEICTFNKNSEKAKQKYNMIEKSKINILNNKGCEFLKQKNYYEAKIEFSEGLIRAKNINDSNLIELLSGNEEKAKSALKRQEDIKKEEKIKELNNLKKQKEDMIKEIKNLHEENQRNINIQINNFIKIEIEKKNKLEELKRKMQKEKDEKLKEEKKKQNEEKIFNKKQLKQSRKEFIEIKKNYLNIRSKEIVLLFYKESKMCNNEKIKSIINSRINNISFENDKKYKISIRKFANNFFNLIKKNKNKIKIKHLNIILVGPTGVGKSTLINTILQLNKEKELKTQVGEPCTMGKPKYYESNKFTGIRLADSRGIEKNKKYGIDEVYKDISDFIVKKEKTGEPDQFVHCIWYCLSDSRFEDIEIEYIKKLSTLYSGNGNLPLIIVYTKSIYKEFYIGLKNKIEKNKINFPVVPVIAKPIFDISGDQFLAIPTKGFYNLIDHSIKVGQQGFENAIFSSVKQRLTKEIESTFEEINKNFFIGIKKFNTEKEKEICNDYDVNNFILFMKKFYDEELLINSKKIEKEFSFFYDMILSEGKNKIKFLVDSEIEKMLQYLQEEQLKIFDKYGKNFIIEKENVLEQEIYSFLNTKLSANLNNYIFNNYINYYKKYIFPGICKKIKKLYNDFVESLGFTSNINIDNYFNLAKIYSGLKKKKKKN